MGIVPEGHLNGILFRLREEFMLKIYDSTFVYNVGGSSRRMLAILTKA